MSLAGSSAAKTGILVVITVLGLSACSAGLQADKSAQSVLVGLTLSEAEQHTREDTLFYVQDASPRVDLEPTFSLDDMFSSRWVIVAACSDAATLESSRTIEIAVIPTLVAEKGVHFEQFADAVACQF